MNALAFDTHEYVKRLKAVGVTEVQAEVHTTMMVDLMTTQMVTRDYLDQSLKDLRSEIDLRFKDLRSEIDLRFKDVDTRFKDVHNEIDLRFKDVDTKFKDLHNEIDLRFKGVDARFDALELRLTIKLGTMMVLAIGIVATLVKIL